MKSLPKREFFLKYVLKALDELGGSGSIVEINNKVAEELNISADLLSMQHKNTNQTEFEYQLAWVRTMLKNHGLIENSSRGVWVLKAKSSDFEFFAPDKKAAKQIDAEIEAEENWKSTAMSMITNHISPNAFERLMQRILREKGFVQVEVTGKSGDGGIDGRGIAKINGILSFYVVFQCKRYKGKVTSKEIRDFRGAMVGRTDKGLFVTTSSFTRDAIAEATRDGAPTIDLIDGDKLAENLKELGLGIKVKIREEISVDEDWFKSFDS